MSAASFVEGPAVSSEIAPEIALVVPADRIAGGNSGRLRDGGSEIAASEKSVGSRFETRLRAICSFVCLRDLRKLGAMYPRVDRLSEQ